MRSKPVFIEQGAIYRRDLSMGASLGACTLRSQLGNLSEELCYLPCYIHTGTHAIVLVAFCVHSNKFGHPTMCSRLSVNLDQSQTSPEK